MALEELIAVARGDAPGDLLLANARIVNVFTSEIEEGDVVLFDGRIAGLGRGYHARREVDLGGAYLLPGFINGHTHIESSMLSIGQYARAVVAHGTTSVVTDLHELANVAGLWALRRLLRDAARPDGRPSGRLPLDVFLMAPSCVPATGLETAGAALEPKDIARALRWPNTLGLGELMNFPGVLAGDPHCLDKARVVGDRLIDGHAPWPHRQGPQRLPGRRPPLRPRIDPPGGGPRQAAPRHAPHDPRGHDREEPGGAPAPGDRRHLPPLPAGGGRPLGQGPPPRRRSGRRGAQGDPPGPGPGAGRPARHHQPRHLLRAARPRGNSARLSGQPHRRRRPVGPAGAAGLLSRPARGRRRPRALPGRYPCRRGACCARCTSRPSGRRLSSCAHRSAVCRSSRSSRADHHSQGDGGRAPGGRPGAWRTRSAIS